MNRANKHRDCGCCSIGVSLLSCAKVRGQVYRTCSTLSVFAVASYTSQCRMCGVCTHELHHAVLSTTQSEHARFPTWFALVSEGVAEFHSKKKKGTCSFSSSFFFTQHNTTRHHHHHHHSLISRRALTSTLSHSLDTQQHYQPPTVSSNQQPASQQPTHSGVTRRAGHRVLQV